MRWLAAALMAGAPAAFGQDSYVVSLSGDGLSLVRDFEDQELIELDSASGSVKPWLRTATGAFFTGDVTGDGLADEWNDVDAFSIVPGSIQPGEVYLSLLSDLGGLMDGDLLRLRPDGSVEVAFAEAVFLQDFGLTDGNCDLDAFHFDSATGVHWLSFAETEDSSVLSTDNAGQISDGAVLWWDPGTPQVGVVYSEGEVDAMVAAAGAGTSAGDVLAISSNAQGDLLFVVQSPSDHDASILTDAQGGQILVDEASLLFTNNVEVNALALAPAPADFFVAATEPGQVPAGSTFSLELDGPPLTTFWVLFALQDGDASLHPGAGFHGLHLSAADPLLWWTLGATWLHGMSDSLGQAMLTIPAAPAGFSGRVLGQVYDPANRVYGTPFAVELF